MVVGILIAIALLVATAAVVFALVLLTTAVNRLALTLERQAEEELKAQQAIADELRHLRESLQVVKVKVLGRVVTGKP